MRADDAPEEKALDCLMDAAMLLKVCYATHEVTKRRRRGEKDCVRLAFFTEFGNQVSCKHFVSAGPLALPL